MFVDINCLEIPSLKIKYHFIDDYEQKFMGGALLSNMLANLV